MTSTFSMPLQFLRNHGDSDDYFLSSLYDEQGKPLGLKVFLAEIEVFGSLVDEVVRSTHVCGEDISVEESFMHLGSIVLNNGKCS